MHAAEFTGFVCRIVGVRYAQLPLLVKNSTVIQLDLRIRVRALHNGGERKHNPVVIVDIKVLSISKQLYK